MNLKIAFGQIRLRLQVELSPVVVAGLLIWHIGHGGHWAAESALIASLMFQNFWEQRRRLRGRR